MKTLNAHKIAWQMLHAELRRRMRPDSGMPGLDESETFARLYQLARAAGISDLNIMIELAGFAASFAQMTRKPLGVAQQVLRRGWPKEGDNR